MKKHVIAIITLIVVMFLLSACATTPTYKKACRHDATTLQTQGFKENEWCWATLVDGKVEWTRQDYWFNPKKVYTFKEYMALWFRVWDIEEKESPR
jgi:hypothetical protein